MHRIHAWMPPRWVRLWALAATRAGDGWLWAAIGFAVLLSGEPDRLQAAEACLLASGTGIAMFQALKRATGRRRPCEVEPHRWAAVLPPDEFSFPSGHTITAFSIAVTIGLFYPSLLLPLLFVALSIAASRILLGMHFLSDVVAGILIGGSLGYASWLLAR